MQLNFVIKNILDHYAQKIKYNFKRITLDIYFLMEMK